VTILFCAMIQACYFADFNHRSGLSVSLFIVVICFRGCGRKVFCCNAYPRRGADLPPSLTQIDTTGI